MTSKASTRAHRTRREDGSQADAVTICVAELAFASELLLAFTISTRTSVAAGTASNYNLGSIMSLGSASTDGAMGATIVHIKMKQQHVNNMLKIIGRL